MNILNWIISNIFGQGAIFLALIACIGLMLQKKKFSEVLRGTVMTAIGYFVLNTGTGLITGSSIDGITGAFGTMMGSASAGAKIDMGQFGTQIGIVMLIGFGVNLLVARFTKFKTVFLTGHMLYWFPYVFIAAGVDAGLSGAPLIILAGIFTALYMVVSPALMKPFVKEVTGEKEATFSIGHPTTCLSVVSGLLGRALGDKSKSAEDIEVPASLGFLKEISITGSLAIALTYVVMIFVLKGKGLDPYTVWGTTSLFTYIFTHAVYFGVGMTIMLQGVRMLIGEIVPAFKGIAEKVVPDAIPALDCPVLFGYAPNSLTIGFIVALITSTITIIIVNSMGVFPTVIVPLVTTCFFEIGCAAIVGNATGGLRGCIIGAAVCGILAVLLVGFGSYFFMNTINDWMLVYGGQDFSLWGIVEGLIARIIA